MKFRVTKQWDVDASNADEAEEQTKTVGPTAKTVQVLPEPARAAVRQPARIAAPAAPRPGQ